MAEDTNIALIEALPLAAMLVGRDERVILANSRARRLLGLDPAGRHYITALRQPVLLDAIETVLSGGESRAEALYLASEASRDTTYRVTVAEVRANGVPAVLLAFEDMTGLQDAEQMRRDFVANVSHELRTPLTALLGFIETLKGAAKDDPAARERFLSIMEREAGRMNRLVRDLLSLSRVEGEERVRPRTPVDLAASVRSTVATLRGQAESRGVSLILEGTEDVVTVPGDPDQLAQVVANLVENAIKYGPRDARVVVSLDRAAQHPDVRGPAVVLAVSDEGDGIDPVHIPRLTERFYRVDSHRSREMGGTGLGLAIVKHIVNRHRGRLRIESSKGDGSRFTIVLPASDGSQPALS